MRTGDLARLADVKAETVLFYEKEGLLPHPARTQSNYRDYGKSDVARLLFIRRSRDLGFDLQSVRKLLTLADDLSQPCDAIDAIASEQLSKVKRKVADLKALQSELQNVVGQCKSGTVSDCRIIETLGSL